MILQRRTTAKDIVETLRKYVCIYFCIVISDTRQTLLSISVSITHDRTQDRFFGLDV